MSNGPMEPSADHRAVANTLRQMFVALMQEGFEESQALTIIGQVIFAQLNGESG